MKSFNRITGKEIEYNLANIPQIVFEVTDACNLRCKYCGYGELYGGYDKREDIMLPIHKAKLIIDYFHTIWKENHCKGIIMPMSISFYGGEPLMNISFVQNVIKYLESLEPVGKKFHYNMTTNAMLLNRYMVFLVEKEFRLLISLDGNEVNQSYRVDANGKNSFNRVFSNIIFLQTKYPEYFKRFVMFNAVLHNRNSVESIYNFITKTFGKQPSISPLNNAGIRKDKVEEFEQTYRNYSESIQQATNCEALKSEIFIKNPETRELLDYLHSHSGNVFYTYNDLLFKKEDAIIPPTGTCIPFSKKMFVTVNGNILQCERINHEFALGKVTDTEVLLDTEKVAEQHNNYVFRYSKQCKGCAEKSSCRQCVYQIDNIHDENTQCLSFCSKQQWNEQKEKSLTYLSKHPSLYKRLLEDVVIRG